VSQILLAKDFHRLWIIFLLRTLFYIRIITVKLLGSFCLITLMSYLHDKSNFTGITLETAECSLILSYLSTIRRLIALHYHGQSYRGHLIVFIIGAIPQHFRYYHWAGLTSNTSTYASSTSCVFGKQLIFTLLCTLSGLLLAYLQRYFADFLKDYSAITLAYYAHPLLLVLVLSL